MVFLDQIVGWANGELLRYREYSGIAEPAGLALLSIFLVVFGAMSRRWLNFLVATLFAAIGFVISIAPSTAGTTIAIGAGFGSLLISIAGIRSKRLESLQREEIAKLAEEIRQLQAEAERQFLRTLNTRPVRTEESS
jgi:hypothetical protein